MDETSQVVRFPIKAVTQLLRHSRKHPRCWPSTGHLFDGKYRKDARTVPMDGRHWPRMDEVDPAKVVPYVMIVKDFGAYLMGASTVPLGRNGRAVLDGQVRQGEVEPFVVYGAGMNPNCDELFDEAAREVFGGDDVAEPLPLEWMEKGVERSVAAGMAHLVLHVNDEVVAFCLPVGGV